MKVIEKWGAEGAALVGGATLGVAQGALSSVGCSQLAGYVGMGLKFLSSGSFVAGYVGAGAAIGGMAVAAAPFLAIGGIIGVLAYAFSDD